MRNTDTTTDRVVIIDEQRNLQPVDGEGDPGDHGDPAEGPRGEHQQSSNGQASHRGLIPRARVKVRMTTDKSQLALHSFNSSLICK